MNMINNTLCVTVVIPLYNKAEYISRTLHSVFAQSLSDFEIIVIDDGSTDGGGDAARSFSDPRLRLISQENGGVSVARNRGILEAKTEFVAFLDADDQWHPDFLATLWAAKGRHTEGKFFASSREIVSLDGTRMSLDFGYRDGFAIDLIEFMDCCVRFRSPLIPSAVMVSKPLLMQVGMFPEGQKRGEDLDTWVRLLFEVPVIFCNMPLVVYWSDLPLSACVSCQDTYLDGNKLLEILEERLAAGIYRGRDRIKVLDYLAWYTAGPVDRLIFSGRCTEARRYILSSLRSKRLRKRYLLAYLKSFCLPFLKMISVQVTRALSTAKTWTFFGR